MIKRIQLLQNFYIYKSFSWANKLPDFADHNFILGYNGSGKTTLSRFFNQLAKGSPMRENEKFRVITSSGELTEKNTQPQNIAVFNSDFVHDNLDFYNNKISLGQNNIKIDKEISKLSQQKASLVEQQKGLEDTIRNYSLNALENASSEQLAALSSELGKYSQFSSIGLNDLKSRLYNDNFKQTYIFDSGATYNNQLDDLKIKANKSNLTKKEANQFVAYMIVEISKEYALKDTKLKRSEVLKRIGAIDRQINSLRQQITSINTTTMNNELHSFLLRDDLKFVLDKSKNMTLTRRGESANNLSDAEKSAVALVFFFNTAVKNDDTVVVLDDPITSMDNQNTFGACHYIRTKTKKQQQLFIFSHSHSLLSSIINTFLGSRKSKQLYFAASVGEGEDRTCMLQSMTETAIGSPYMMYFKLAYEYVNGAKASDISSGYLMPNICRQLLEMFLSFKCGEIELKNSLSWVENNFVKLKYSLPKIKKFIDTYSHSKHQESPFVSYSDNRLFETKEITKAILELINTIDSCHFQNYATKC